MRYGISMADIPLTTGQPDRGAGAYQYTGLTIYDPLIAWELDVTDRPGKMIPGLATEWKVSDTDKTLWTFKLREGVKFHDGSAFDADAVMWNFEKIFNKDAPQFDPRQAAQVRPRIPGMAGGQLQEDRSDGNRDQDQGVDSLFPYQFLWFLMSSPAQLEKVGKDWNKFASEPSGTGPFKLARLVPRERVELVKNENYWNPKRIPKVDRMVLVCTPEDSTRSAALISERRRHDRRAAARRARAPEAERHAHRGQRDAARVPVSSVVQPGSPWADIKVRKAANLAIDRDAIVGLLKGLVKPAYGEVDRTSPWFGKPTFILKYAPDEARKLMTEAGYSKSDPMKTKVSIQAGGTRARR